MRRRNITQGLLGTLLCPSMWAAAAEPYPNKPVRLLVGYPPGGQADSVARLLARELAPPLGASIVIDNRPGAMALIAAETAARAPSDGYTMLLADRGVLAAAPAFEAKLRFDPERDFMLLGRVALVPYMLVARANLGSTDLSQIIAHSRQNPGKLTFAFAGELSRVALQLFVETARIEVHPIPYKSAGQAVLDLAADRVDLMFADPAIIAPMVQAGSIRILACTDRKRSAMYPHAPTMVEMGFEQLIWHLWQSIALPTGTPRHVIDKLTETLKIAQAASAYRAGLAKLGFEPIDETPEQFAAELQSDRRRFKELAQRLRRNAPPST